MVPVVVLYGVPLKIACTGGVPFLLQHVLLVLSTAPAVGIIHAFINSVVFCTHLHSFSQGALLQLSMHSSTFRDF